MTAIVVGAVALAIAAQRKAPPRAAANRAGPPAAASSAEGALWRVPAFSFVDQHGQRTTNANLRGRVWIADFIFTRCTTICPLITAKMAMLQRRLQENQNLRFVSFSVDPEHDTPEALGRYAAEWRPAESRWVLLATTPPALQAFSAGMFVSVKPLEKDIAHSNLFFLVDAEGGVRGIYESDRNDALDRLIRDTEALSQAPSAAPPPRAAGPSGADLYAALGCGACHARPDLAPPLEGLGGRRIELADGATIAADAVYVRESIVAPDAKRTRGYVLGMPSYEKELDARELDALVAYLLEKTNEKTAPPATNRGELAVDPVCSMDVRVVATTPRATHAGRTIYFCSEMCRDRFVTEPARYAK